MTRPSVGAGTLRAVRTSRTLAIGTSVRIVACPVILGLLLGHDYTSGAILFLCAAATDYVDGRLARSWNVVTKLGAFLDTTADKLLVATAMLALVAVGRGSPWVALVIIGREFTILGLRALVASSGSNFETSMFGKWKATIQFIAIALAMFRPHVVFGGAYLDQWVLAVTAVITAWSGIDYLIHSADALKS